MKRIFKRSLSCFLVLFMMLSIVPTFAVTAAADAVDFSIVINLLFDNK